MKRAGAGLAAVLAAFLGTGPLSARARAPATSVYALPLGFHDDGGRARTLADLRGRPVVLALVYTECVTTCPLTMALLKRIEPRLGSGPRAPALVVVTLDPERDTPQVMNAFRRRHRLPAGRWQLLSGSDDDTRALAMLLDFHYAKNPSGNDVMHDNKIFLLSPEGQIRDTLVSFSDDVARFVASARAETSRRARASR